MLRGPSFEWNSLGEQHLKGKALPVTAYALRAADRQTAATRHRRHTLPMIGRDDELAVLDRHIVETADGRGQVVAITAGAGLGKSRLLVEGARLLSERGIRAFEGEAPAFGTRASYAAWHQVWAGLLDLPGQLSSAEQRDLLHDRVAGTRPGSAAPVAAARRTARSGDPGQRADREPGRQAAQGVAGGTARRAAGAAWPRRDRRSRS